MAETLSSGLSGPSGTQQNGSYLPLSNNPFYHSKPFLLYRPPVEFNFQTSSHSIPQLAMLSRRRENISPLDPLIVCRITSNVASPKKKLSSTRFTFLRVCVALLLPLFMSMPALLLRSSSDPRLARVLTNIVCVYCENALVLCIYALLLDWPFIRYFFLLLSTIAVCADYIVQCSTKGSLVIDDLMLETFFAQTRSLLGQVRSNPNSMAGGGHSIISAMFTALAVWIGCISCFHITCLSVLRSSENKLFIQRCLRLGAFVNFMSICLIFLTLDSQIWAPMSNIVRASLRIPLMPKWPYHPDIAAARLKNARSEAAAAAATATTAAAALPNVILFVHESVSGSVVWSPKGAEAMPFFSGLEHYNNDTYLFENGRAAAGITHIAMPAILTGLLPLSYRGAEIMSSAVLSEQMRARGYACGMFSSITLHWSGSKDASLVNHWGRGFHVSESPNLSQPRTVNDDVTYSNMFEWINSTSKPFFALVYTYDQHFPFRVDDEYLRHRTQPDNVADNINSLRSMDRNIERLYTQLSVLDLLDRTVMMGAADHGETPLKPGARNHNLHAAIMHVPIWMHVPSQFLTMHQRLVLRQNTKQLVHTLDLVPTLRAILNQSPEFSEEEQKFCATGKNLIAEKVDDDRLTISYQGAPILPWNNKVYAVSNQEKAVVLGPTQRLISFDGDYGDTDDPTRMEEIAITELDDDTKDEVRTMLSSPQIHPLFAEQIPSINGL